MVGLALVRLWGQLVGAVRWDATRALATFAYDPAFIKSGDDWNGGRSATMSTPGTVAGKGVRCMSAWSCFTPARSQYRPGAVLCSCACRGPLGPGWLECGRP